jgi:hypothetical protein
VSRVDEIRARLRAATPGPWARNGQGGSNLWRIDSLGAERVGIDFLAYPLALFREASDADLVANASADIEFLLAEVDRLEHLRAELRRLLQLEPAEGDWWDDPSPAHLARRDPGMWATPEDYPVIAAVLQEPQP